MRRATGPTAHPRLHRRLPRRVVDDGVAAGPRVADLRRGCGRSSRASSTCRTRIPTGARSASRGPVAPATRPSTTSATTCCSTPSTRADVAGVLIEPVLGSGGVVAPPATFFPALQALCREHDWLLCADEVKTGCGRTGTFLAVERLGVRPDLICLGKGLGRRRDADRRRAGHRAGARRVRRRARPAARGPGCRAAARPPWPCSTRSTARACSSTCARSRRGRARSFGVAGRRSRRASATSARSAR